MIFTLNYSLRKIERDEKLSSFFGVKKMSRIYIIFIVLGVVLRQNVYANFFGREFQITWGDDTENYPNCTAMDRINCCTYYSNLRCSEFDSKPYSHEICGKACGIPCIDDSPGTEDEGVIIEAIDNSKVCVDDKPEVCCEFLATNRICSKQFFSGCMKTCSQCEN